LPLLDAPISDKSGEGSIIEFEQQRGPRLIEYGAHTPPDKSVASLVEFLAHQGVELSIARGQLVVRSRAPLRQDVRDVVLYAEPLLVGYLAGSPTKSSVCDELATTVVFPRAPMCAEHAQ
jgi:hypothetical protein